MRLSWVWLGMVFHTLPVSSTVIPMTNWQDFSTSGCIYWLITRLLDVSALPISTFLAMARLTNLLG
jgi:hypothetical protein